MSFGVSASVSLAQDKKEADKPKVDGPALSKDDPATQAQVDAAVERGLKYLAKTQAKEGYWPSGFGQNVGVTSVACMAFMAAGHVPGEGPYGTVLDKAIDWVVDQQKDNGMIIRDTSQGPMYCHGMATLMLCEAGGMTTGARGEKIRNVVRKAIQVILDAQQIKKNPLHQGGWRYQHSSHDSDISCTGWQIMSLKAAKGNGADVPEEAINRAIEYIRRCNVKGGGFSYEAGSGGPNQPRTGTGILCLEICGRHLLPPDKDHWQESVDGGEWLLAHGINRWDGEHLYYGIYYCTMGMWQLGGKYWQAYWPSMRKLILANQKPDGSWPLEGGSANRAGPAYSTAMALLALGIEYKLLPIYQR